MYLQLIGLLGPCINPDSRIVLLGHISRKEKDLPESLRTLEYLSVVSALGTVGDGRADTCQASLAR